MSNDEKQVPRQPWEQRESEGQKAFRAFVFYRDLGLDRSLNLAYRACVRDENRDAPGTWQAWSREFEWVDRCRAYDAHCDDLRRKTRERRIAELEDRRFDFEFENQGLLENWVRNLDEKLWQTLQEGFTETKEQCVKDGETGELVVIKRETKVKFPALGSFARLLEARNDTGRQAVEGPRKKPDQVASDSAAPNSDATTESAGKPSEFVWIAPAPEQPDPAPAEPEGEKKSD